MALETPNGIVASLVLYLDTSLPIGDRISIRSSNGILAKVLEAELAPGSAFIDVFSFEHPVDNDEAVILTGGVVLSGQGPFTPIVWVTPLPQTLLVPLIDNLPPNLLTMFIDPKIPSALARITISVLGLITTAPRIAGEPLP